MTKAMIFSILMSTLLITLFVCKAGATDCVKKRNGLYGFTVCADDDTFKGADGKACSFLHPLKVEG